MPYKSQYASPYQCLGIATTASEADIRTAYRALVLKSHPDKVPESDREEATSIFQEINAAYEVCLHRLLSPKSAYVDEWEYDSEDDDDAGHWRDNLAPAEQPMMAQEWWDELTLDDPEPVRAWGKACKKAYRNSRLKMTDTEREILNMEYQQAYEKYELYRRKEEDEYFTREANWHQEAELNEREYRNMRYFREKKEEEKEKLGDSDAPETYGYVENIDEERCFYDDPDAQADDKKNKSVLAQGWRDPLWNDDIKPAQQRLKQAENELKVFRAQIKALEEREKTLPKGRGHSQEFAKAKAKSRARVEAQLKKVIVKTEKELFKAGVQRNLLTATRTAHKKGMELDYRDIEGVSDARLFEEVFLPAEMTAYFLEASKEITVEPIEVGSSSQKSGTGSPECELRVTLCWPKQRKGYMPCERPPAIIF